MKHQRILVSVVLLFLTACATPKQNPDPTTRALASPIEDASSSDGVLPNAALAQFVNELPVVAPRADPTLLSVRVTDVSSDSIYRPALEDAKARGEDGIDQPIQVSSQLVVMFEPSLSPADAASALADYQLYVIRTLPQIGAVVVDASQAVLNVTGSLESGGAEAAEAPINQLAAQLAQDDRFEAVSAETLLTSLSIVTATRPELLPNNPVSRGVTTASQEVTDWGIVESGIDAFWPQMTQPVTVGVIDAGFAWHEDLPIVSGLPTAWFKNDHGNHVAGIMCARHNGVGVKGVLANCNVAAAGASFLLPDYSPPEGFDESAFVTRFSAYIGTVLDFMEANPDAKVLNLSLGYNWMPNFNIDPRDPGNKKIRNMIRGQGRMFQSILAYAKCRDIAIFSAAGNDSTDLTSPLPAELASPFNFGAKLMENVDGWTNGIIVEAYNRQSMRARFSNADGHIACPGVNIVSAVATPANGYGRMSGTSMASPYCAAAFAGLRSLYPDASLQEVIECFLTSQDRIDGRVPKMNLRRAFEACRADELNRIE